MKLQHKKPTYNVVTFYHVVFLYFKANTVFFSRKSHLMDDIFCCCTFILFQDLCTNIAQYNCVPFSSSPHHFVQDFVISIFTKIKINFFKLFVVVDVFFYFFILHCVHIIFSRDTIDIMIKSAEEYEKKNIVAS